MKTLRVLPFLLVAMALPGRASAAQQARPVVSTANITRATLGNGAKVVIIHNALAPVVTVEANFMVGGNETPPGFPGMAHAQEHMVFRGCTGMTADQTAAIYALLGGENNADTQQNITQYFATVPSADLDVALEAQAACLRGVDNSQAEWDAGARRDRAGSAARSLQSDLQVHRPHERDHVCGHALCARSAGHEDSFDATTGPMLKDFYDKWYTPSNMILIVVGDVDPAATLAKIKSLFGDIPNHPDAERPAIHLQPFKDESFTLDSNLPYVLGFIAYRLPGTDSPDYAAVQILADVLASQRADLYGMVPAGKALAAEFGVAETYARPALAMAW